MSNMNTIPQTPKSHDRFSGTQDHGTRGNTYLRAYSSYNDDDAEANHIATEQRNRDLREGMDEYLDGLSPAQLEAEADKILGENESDYAFTVESSDLMSEASSILAAAGERYDDVKELLFQYEDLHQKLLTTSLGVDVETPEQTEIKAEMDDIEEAIHDLVESAEELPTVNEMGLKTMREIRADLARAATLDEDYSEDDFGDNSYTHVQIRNSIR